MVKDSRGIAQNIGARLRRLRNQHNYTRPEMAAELGIHRTAYYKNETGETFPGSNTLYRLQKHFNISIDWLLFNKGPMHFKDKLQPAEKTPGLAEQVPEVREMLDVMARDPQLKHEILAYFFKYQGKKRLQKPEQGNTKENK
jgi:transcriptional regulator with XRE-family HTH domain